MIENFGDAPFFPQRVPAETVAQMTALAALVRSQTDLPLGINVLRNDGQSALAIAQAVGANFIRVNILCGGRVTDQGLIQGIAHDLLRDRVRLGAEEYRDPRRRGRETFRPFGRAALGAGSGRPHRARRRGWPNCLRPRHRPGNFRVGSQEVQTLAGNVPVFVGSGVSEENLADFLPAAAGFIVGTAFKHEGRPAGNPVDKNRVQSLMQKLWACVSPYAD